MKLKLMKEKLEALGMCELRRIYDSVCILLEDRNNNENLSTEKEHKFGDLIKKNTKLTFYTSFWIGKRNMDIFIPSIRGTVNKTEEKQKKSFKGLAIEVDGDVHNQEWKMRKDQSKYEKIHDMGIGLYTVENYDFNKNSVSSFLKSIKYLPRLDSRARKRLIRRVYIETILSNLSDAELHIKNL